MCQTDPQTMDKLTETVQQFLEEGRAFTGYDVTIETRDREGIKLRHRDCRADIHEISDLRDAVDYGYENKDGDTIQWHQSQIAHPNGSPVLLYHPDSYDPQSYQFRDGQQAAQTAAPASSPVAASTSSDSSATDANGPDDGSDAGGKQTDGTFLADYRRRLFIPTQFCRDAGVEAGDTMHVLHDVANSKIVLSKTELDGLNALTKKTVERNGDLRLSPSTLTDAGFSHTDRFNIENAKRDDEQVIEITTV